ncbi:MAG: type II secretion system minor pseudopilin GspI [Burkholderiales bacterium]|nr:type II secretion system minor pseudopilin GspI [Burkholderiales bacterium]
MRNNLTHQRGFTLVEILVALAIVAVALSAGLQATGALTRMAERQPQQWLAQLCAENELTRLRLLRQLPPVGESSSSCEQAGQTLTIRLRVNPTPNPSFRRVEAAIDNPDPAAGGGRLLQLSTIMGRY